MYRVLICDDTRSYAEYLYSLIIKCSNNNLEIDICESGEDCKKKIDSDITYNWLIVDLELGDINGYEIAEYYKKIVPKGILFICSGVFQPTPASFEYMPLRFIEKGQSESEIIRYIKVAIERLHKQQSDIYIDSHIRKDIYRICLEDIVYIENQINGRGSVVYLAKNRKRNKNIDKVYMQEKLQDLYKTFKRSGLEYVNKRCLVNMEYINSIEKGSIILDGNIQINISRSVKEQFRTSYIDYIMYKNGMDDDF